MTPSPQPNPTELEKAQPWSVKVMREINSITPMIHGKSSDPDWFLLRQRLEEYDALESKLKEVEKERDNARHQVEAFCNLNLNIADTLRIRGFTGPKPLDERVIALAQTLDSVLSTLNVTTLEDGLEVIEQLTKRSE